MVFFWEACNPPTCAMRSGTSDVTEAMGRVVQVVDGDRVSPIEPVIFDKSMRFRELFGIY